MARFGSVGITALVGATIALVAGGCSASDRQSDAPTASTTETSTPAESGDASERDDVDSALPPGAVTLLDAGAEPRAPLRITTAARSRLSVEASDSLGVTIGDTTTDTGGTATYELDLDLTLDGNDAQLLATPTIVSFDGPTPTPDDLGAWRWFLDERGMVQRVVSVGWGDQVPAATLELLNVANLVLVAPDEPVGDGASWSQSLSRRSDARLVFELVGSTDSEVEVSLELESPFEGGVATLVASGTYDRATLLARELTLESSLEVTSAVSDNGDLVDLTGVERSRRTFTEVPE